MKQFSSSFFAAAAALTVAIFTPAQAQAGGSIHIDVPGFSIGVHDDGYHRHRKYKKRYRHKQRNRYYDRHYYDPYYYEPRRKRYYKRRYYRDRYYHNDYYRDNYYHGKRRYYRPRRVEVCPMAGYSPYYDRYRSCRRHKNHFHCD